MKKQKIFCLVVLAFLLFQCVFMPVAYGVENAFAQNTVGIPDAQETANDPLPKAYCMRDEYILFAQNQDAHGYCWNFATTMAAATTLMRATGEFYDFSELWTGVSACAFGHHSTPGSGGGFDTQYTAMQKAGLMLECDLPYQNSYTVSAENAMDYFNFFGKYSCDALASCLVSDQQTNFGTDEVEKMKKHIYENGSVYMAFNFRTGFIDDGPSYYLTPHQQNTTSAHAISVIGWDDDYTRELCVDGSDTPQVYRGAWIVMNSYTETNSKDGIAYIFYEDSNITSLKGYRYAPDTAGDFWFYDKIETGYAYPTNVKGKYYGDFSATEAPTKQKNIFYDDVSLTYSYIAPEGVEIQKIDIFLGEKMVTDRFALAVDCENKRFSLSCNEAQYGQYKLLVTYTNGRESDTYLNNFFVTYGLIGEGVEFDNEKNSLSFNTGRDLEFYSFSVPDKHYVIYTDTLSGTVEFLPLHTSVYSEVNMSLPPLSYQITDGKGSTLAHTVISPSGYTLTYTFHIEYREDTTLQPVYVYYDLDGGENHAENHSLELASPTSELLLYAPTREGYTFDGWYLDYGNGSIKLTEEDGVYSLGWDDIHHMGETPKLRALSHYNKYYNNSSTVFVYARWKEADYHDIQVDIVGNGAVQTANQMTVRQGETVTYIFDPDARHTLTKVEIDGVAVSDARLMEIAKNGLRLEGIGRDMSVKATFSEGYYLIIETGENIKDAYVTRTATSLPNIRDQQKLGIPEQTIGTLPIEVYHSGECIPMPSGIGAFGALSLTLYVEVFDREEGYTYLLDDATSYQMDSAGRYYKTIFAIDKNGIFYFKVGSAARKKITDVKVKYSVPKHVTEHYISKNQNATEGDAHTVYQTGDIVYLFVKKPMDTAQYRYTMPNEYTALPGGWYRRAMVVDPDKPDFGTVSVSQTLMRYTVTWQNWDGSVLLSEKYEYGVLPQYPDAPPTRPTDTCTYDFIGWSPDIAFVQGNATYTAEFLAGKITFTVRIHCQGNGTATPSGEVIVEYGSALDIRMRPDANFCVEKLLVNGVETPPQENLSLENITENVSVEIVFGLSDAFVRRTVAWAITATVSVIAAVIFVLLFHRKRGRKKIK